MHDFFVLSIIKQPNAIKRYKYDSNLDIDVEFLKFCENETFSLFHRVKFSYTVL